MPTKQNVIDRFLMTFPDATASQAGGYFDEALRWVILNLPLQREAKTIDLVNDTWKYDLPTGELLEIEQVIYATGVDSEGDYEGSVLSRRTIPYSTALDEEVITDLTAGAPLTTYALVSVPNTASNQSGKEQIWVWPRYNGTPADGYPKLVIWGRWHTALDATTRNIPSSIPDTGAIVAKMKQYYLEDVPEERNDSQKFEQEAERKLQLLQAYHAQRASQHQARLVPLVLAQGRRTV